MTLKRVVVVETLGEFSHRTKVSKSSQGRKTLRLTMVWISFMRYLYDRSFPACSLHSYIGTHSERWKKVFQVYGRLRLFNRKMACERLSIYHIYTIWREEKGEIRFIDFRSKVWTENNIWIFIIGKMYMSSLYSLRENFWNKYDWWNL